MDDKEYQLGICLNASGVYKLEFNKLYKLIALVGSLVNAYDLTTNKKIGVYPRYMFKIVPDSKLSRILYG